MELTDSNNQFEQLKQKICSNISTAKDVKDLLKIVEGDLKLVTALVYKRKHLSMFTPWSSFRWTTRTRNRILYALKYQQRDWIEDFDDYPDIDPEDLPLVLVSEIVTKNLLKQLQGAGDKTFQEIENIFKKYGLTLGQGREYYPYYQSSSYRKYLFSSQAEFNRVNNI